jgi:hypothetical protein
MLLVVFTEQVGDNLRVCLGCKGMPLRFEFVFEFLEIFHDAILHNHNVPALVGVGVGVFLRDAAVGCPTGVSNAKITDQLGSLKLGRKVAQFAHTALYLELRCGVIDRNASRIIPAVFKSL